MFNRHPYTEFLTLPLPIIANHCESQLMWTHLVREKADRTEIVLP